MTDTTTAPDEGPVTIQPAGEDPGHAIPAPLSEHVATGRYRAAWLAHVEAYNRAAMLSRDAHVPAVLPLWQAALVDRDAAFDTLRTAQARLREALLAIGYTETEAAVRRAEIDRGGAGGGRGTRGAPHRAAGRHGTVQRRPAHD